MYNEDRHPLITLKWSQTLDGQLADDMDHSQWISGHEERRYTQELRGSQDAILVGARTFLNDRCQLTVRTPGFRGTQPARIIMDPRGRILEAVQKSAQWIDLLEQGPRRSYLLTDVIDDGDSLAAQELLLKTGNILMVPYRFEYCQQWLPGAITQLSSVFGSVEDRRLRRLMVEGGARTLAGFLDSNLADRLEVSISPLILGGVRHRVATNQLLKDAARFAVDSQERLGADILLRYTVKRPLIELRSHA